LWLLGHHVVFVVVVAVAARAVEECGVLLVNSVELWALSACHLVLLVVLLNAAGACREPAVE